MNVDRRGAAWLARSVQVRLVPRRAPGRPAMSVVQPPEVGRSVVVGESPTLAQLRHTAAVCLDHARTHARRADVEPSGPELIMRR